MKQQDFINKIGAMATADMQKTGILASLTIAQAILESGWGESGLTKCSNNLFGIKGRGVNSQTFEYINGERVDCTASFKKYPSWQASVADHSALFHRLPRYKNLIGCKYYKKACKNVQADGYATAPTYATCLINLIEQYDLTKFDVVSKPVTPPPALKPQPKPTPAKPTQRAGDRVVLTNTPLYASSTAKSCVRKANGTYFLYDGVVINSRCRITNNISRVNKKPMFMFVTGWIDVKW